MKKENIHLGKKMLLICQGVSEKHSENFLKLYEALLRDDFSEREIIAKLAHYLYLGLAYDNWPSNDYSIQGLMD